jgi:hypothetical protein
MGRHRSAVEKRTSSPHSRMWRAWAVVFACGVGFAALEACISLDGLTGGPVDGGLDAVKPDAEASAGDVSSVPVDAAIDATRADQYRDAVLADSPLAYWRLDELTGTTAVDEKHGHDGVYKVAPTLGAVGIFDSPGAITLPDGTHAHVEVPGTDFAFAGNAAYSVELWVKPKSSNSIDWIISTEVTPPRSGWSVMTTDTGELLFEVWRNTDAGAAQARVLDTTQVLTPDHFHHVVVSYGGTIGGNMMRAYVDGTIIKSDPAPNPAPDGGVLLFGCRRNSDGTVGGCLDGWTLDEVAIYGAALSEDRVRAHYDLGKPPAP